MQDFKLTDKINRFDGRVCSIECNEELHWVKTLALFGESCRKKSKKERI